MVLRGIIYDKRVETWVIAASTPVKPKKIVNVIFRIIFLTTAFF